MQQLVLGQEVTVRFGLGFRGLGVVSGVWGVGCGVWGVACIVQGIGCRVWGVMGLVVRFQEIEAALRGGACWKSHRRQYLTNHRHSQYKPFPA